VVDTFLANGFSAELQIRGKPPQECLQASPQHQTCSVLKNLLRIDKITDVFLVVRNPYARMRSEYNWCFRDIPPSDRMSYSEWVLCVLDEASKDNSYADNHFRPALDFLDFEIPAKIFRLEDGLDVVVEYYLQTMSSAMTSISVLHEKNSLKFKNKTTLFELNSDALAAINEHFRVDFIAFGYSMMHDSKSSIFAPIPDTCIDLNIWPKLEAAKRWHSQTFSAVKEKLQDQIWILHGLTGKLEGGVSSGNHAELEDVSSLIMRYAIKQHHIQLELDRIRDFVGRPFGATKEGVGCDDIHRDLNVLSTYRSRMQELTKGLQV